VYLYKHALLSTNQQQGQGNIRTETGWANTALSAFIIKETNIPRGGGGGKKGKKKKKNRRF